MNKKLVLKKENGDIVYCVLSGEAYEDDELKKVFGIEPGYGLTAAKYSDKVCVENYFRGDTVATFPIVSFEDTDEEPLYNLTPCE